MIIDILKQEINVGDTVVFNPPSYSGLTYGKVIKLTPKGATITYNKGSKCNRPAIDLVKITDQLRIAKETNPEYYI